METHSVGTFRSTLYVIHMVVMNMVNPVMIARITTVCFVGKVRDTQQENISRMIGLCLSSSDPKSSSEKWDQILILTEYCSRGSLRDVLLNAHIHLDWPFRLSLISDIVNVSHCP